MVTETRMKDGNGDGTENGSEDEDGGRRRETRMKDGSEDEDGGRRRETRREDGSGDEDGEQS